MRRISIVSSTSCRDLAVLICFSPIRRTNETCIQSKCNASFRPMGGVELRLLASCEMLGCSTMIYCPSMGSFAFIPSKTAVKTQNQSPLLSVVCSIVHFTSGIGSMESNCNEESDKEQRRHREKCLWERISSGHRYRLT